MKIYLLLIDHERFFFYSDESESSHDESEGDDSSSPPRSGLRGWLHDRYSRFKVGLGTCGVRRLALDAPRVGLVAVLGSSG